MYIPSTIHRAFLISLTFLLAACSSGLLIPSARVPSHVAVDGDASEWNCPLEYFDKESRLNFTIANDDSTFYLCAQAYDLQTQLKIIRGGLQIWLDTTGGKESQVGLLFPAPNPEEAAELNRIRVSRNAEVFDPILGMQRDFHSTNHRLRLTGFKPPIEGLFQPKNSFGIEAAIGWDTINDVLNYEVAIPFRSFFKEVLASRDSDRAFGLTITVNGIPRPHVLSSEMHEQGHESSGPPAGAGSGGRGGGMGRMGGVGRRGGGTRGGEDPSKDDMAKNSTFWVRLKFSTAK